MSEQSGIPERPRTHLPQPPLEGHRPLAHIIQDSLDEPKTRRSLLAGLAAGGMALAGFGAKELTQNEQASAGVEHQTSKEEEKLDNHFVFIKRDEDGKLTYADRNTAQIYDVKFSAEFAAGNEDMIVPFRNEPKATSKAFQALTNPELSQLTFGAIRVGSVYDNKRPEDSFVDQYNNRIYEWLVPIRRTGDPEKPYVYMDGHGNDSDIPWFVSPNFASLQVQSVEVVPNPPSPPEEQ